MSESELRNRVSNRVSGTDAALPLSMHLEVPCQLWVRHTDKIWMALSVEVGIQRQRPHARKPRFRKVQVHSVSRAAGV